MNNDSKNEGLNAISLGNTENISNVNVPINEIPPIEPVVPIESIENLDDTPALNMVEEASVNNPLPPVEPVIQNATISTVTPINYDIPETINNFNPSSVFNEIGTVPPIQNIPAINNGVNNSEPQKNKKGISKILFVIIIVLAITAVGVAIYILLHIANEKKVQVKTNNINIEVGSEISTVITDYATFKGINSNTCALDTTGITDTTTVNVEYTYIIKCNGIEYKGTAKIVDTIKPEVKLKELTVGLNANISAEDFIESCTDNTKCRYEFKDEEKVRNNLKETASYHVELIIKDEANNITEATATLIVSESVANVFLVCNKNTTNYEEVNRFGLIDGSFNKMTTRIYNFKIHSREEYNSVKSASGNSGEINYKNITGKPTFNDEEQILTITKSLTYEELNREASSIVPESYGELKDFYRNRGYSCTIGY